MDLIVNDDTILYAADELVLPGTLNDGLVFLHLCTDTVARAAKNRAAGQVDASVVGTPDDGAGYLSFQGVTKQLVTALNEAAAMTYATVCKSAAGSLSGTGRPIFVGNFGETTLTGCSLYASSNAQLTAAARYTNGTPVTRTCVISDTPANWGLRMAWADDTEVCAANVTAATVGTPTAGGSGYTRLVNGQHVRIGGGYTATSFNGVNDQVLAAGWNRVLTSDERTAFHAWSQVIAASVGITI
ncbi:hypothetical protein ACFQ1E_08055 [Sphingomonas canadensis]|uniref:Phage tail protein n=1 Tax=Sphingomonas canadensis TaxID=1219257 RepID=A0ABW3H6I4_9SPHN|nr:hypothetical protein [Sphingomonas canadensis]MCW3835989.1 hypothetical protein [Sphingomonas canadensis]